MLFLFFMVLVPPLRLLSFFFLMPTFAFLKTCGSIDGAAARALLLLLLPSADSAARRGALLVVMQLVLLLVVLFLLFSFRV